MLDFNSICMLLFPIVFCFLLWMLIDYALTGGGD